MNLPLATLIVLLSILQLSWSSKENDALMTGLEKELEGAEDERNSATKRASFSSLQSLADVKAAMDALEADLEKKQNDKSSTKKVTKKSPVPESMLAEMAELEKELEAGSGEKKMKKSSDEDSLDELLDELNKKKSSTRNQDALKSKFYKILRTESKRTIVNSKKRSMLEGSLAVVLHDIRHNVKKEKLNDETDCKDVRSDCESLKSYCAEYKEKLTGLCDLTCGYCQKCENKLSDKKCVEFRDNYEVNYCNDVEKYVERMRNNCFKTCGYCKVPSPPKCSQTKYQCCWDKETIKQDEAGSNCPACKDQYKYVCKTFKDDCMSYQLPGDFMRFYCPERCNMCDGSCQDNGASAFYCPFWKKDLNWCVDRKESMRHFCPKTCKFC